MTARISVPTSLLFVALIFQAGLCGSPPPQAPITQLPPGKVLTAQEAATLAARMANDECERLYKKRPFTASRYHAVLKGSSYRWGRLDVTGPGGFSALVTFAANGTDSKVEVYFSTDVLSPPR